MPLTGPARVALVAMPFGGVDRPALGISLLKAALARRGIACDLHYLNIPFAERVGLPVYDELSMLDGRSLRGEQLFAREVFGQRVPEGNIARKPPYQYGAGTSLWDRAEIWQRLCDSTGPFLDACMASVQWARYPIVGFSTTFEQNMASLALAGRIKARWPGTTIVFGGANCEGEMGLELHRQFPCIDVVCSGEGDVVFPLLVERLLAGELPPLAPGLVIRAEGGSQTIGRGAVTVRDLNQLPYPEFEDYFDQIRASPIHTQAEIVLPFESSRGCWYGARQHCTFCGLNGETMAFRSKRPERVLDEVRALTGRYGLRRLAATDNILDMQYLHSLIPELARSGLKLSVHYEVKANLHYEQMRLLKQAGVDRLQPGIESLSTSILKLMQKGCTALQNIQFLKWASALGIDAAWNFLLGFPGEDPQEYVRMAALIPALVHLQPPQGFGFIRLDRFSPYFNDPGRFGLTNVRPAAGYAMSYPFPDDALGRLAYYFEYDYADGRVPARYAAPTVDMLRYWSEFNCPYGFTFKCDGERLILRDRRPKAAQEQGVLTGAEKAAYEYLDAAHPYQALQAHLRACGHPVDDPTLRGWLEAWVRKRWVVRDGNWFLSLAVPMHELL